jgi:phosphoesterase RecJ-like protein
MINEIIKMIMESNKIGITFHESPDGDSLGSSLALLNALRVINKSAYIICKERIPETFVFLPLSEEINGECTEPLQKTDCLITLDCGNVARLNCNADFQNRKFKIINIDHHLSNDKFGDINYVDTTAASVGEIMYKLIKKMNIQIDSSIATCIYTSILTDTGSFRHSNTTYYTHEIVSDLIRSTGVDFSSIHRKIFDNKKFAMIKLQGLVIDELYLTSAGRLCVMKLTQKMLEKVKLDECDSAELISIGLKISGVEAAILIKEKNIGIKASLRSKEYVDVRKIAEIYGGGGHIRASGLSMDVSIDEAEKLLIRDFEEELI